ncbi:MAG TPA: hypothetical protein VG963_25875, partial [Polyangiaceae bacterium]|nr:hypothetical protein [Polyangiaceae bacterium]
LARYERAGMVHGHATLDGAKSAIIAGWEAARQRSLEARQIMLAYRRDDVRDLNARARAVRQAAGELGEDHRVQTERGERDFAAGDRVYFLRNERSLGVKNGTLGTVTAIEGHTPGQGDQLTVRLDDGRAVGFDVKDYAHIDHGYAATVHKSQGVTVDRAHVLASSHMDRHAAYVGLTRHRDRVDLHWSEDQVGSRERLARVLGRERLKDTSLDYGPAVGTPGERETQRDSFADSAKAYAERRGLVPESEIVVHQADRPERASTRSRQSLRERLAGARVREDDPVAAARREVARDRLREAVREHGAGPLAEARADAARLRQAAHVVPGSLEARVTEFQQAYGEAQTYRERFGQALPEQERALDTARQQLERQLPRAAEVLEEALAAGRITVRHNVRLDGLRDAATERQVAHVRADNYERAQTTVTQEAQALTRNWTGSEQQQLAQRALAGQQWQLARAAARDSSLMQVLAKRAPALANQTRHWAAQSETDHQAEVQRQNERQTQRLTRSLGRGMRLGM